MTIFLSQKALRQLENLLDYLETEWSPKVRRDFQKKLDRSIRAIKMMPAAFPPSEIFPNFRKCVVTPQVSLIYRVLADSIEVAVIFDNRSGD